MTADSVTGWVTVAQPRLPWDDLVAWMRERAKARNASPARRTRR